METILIGLAATGTAIIITPLVIVSAGIRRHDRPGSLTRQPSGPASALARRVLGLRTTPLTGSQLNAPPASPARPDSQSLRAAALAGARS